MSTTQSERLRALLEPLVSAGGLDLEDVTVTQAGRRRQLRVVVDADGGRELDAWPSSAGRSRRRSTTPT